MNRKSNLQISTLASLKTFFFTTDWCRQGTRRDKICCSEGFQINFDMGRVSSNCTRSSLQDFRIPQLKQSPKCRESNPRPQVQQQRATATNKKCSSNISVILHFASFSAQLFPSSFWRQLKPLYIISFYNTHDLNKRFRAS